MPSVYFLRGMVMAAQTPEAAEAEYVDLLAVLDQDAAQAAPDELAMVRRLYEREVRKRGREMVWFLEQGTEIVPKLKPQQLLFTLPGVEVYETSEVFPTSKIVQLAEQVAHPDVG